MYVMQPSLTLCCHVSCLRGPWWRSQWQLLGQWLAPTAYLAGAVCLGQLPLLVPPLVLHLVQPSEVAPVGAAAVGPVVVAASLVVAGSLLQVVAASLQGRVSVAPVLALPWLEVEAGAEPGAHLRGQVQRE